MKYLVQILILFLPLSFFAQTRIIEGQVISEYKEPMAYTYVYDIQGNKLTKTDLDGLFHLEIPRDSIIDLYIKYSGYFPEIIPIHPKVKSITVELESTAYFGPLIIMHFDSLYKYNSHQNTTNGTFFLIDKEVKEFNKKRYRGNDR